jgi:tRNA-dihydrouridine synthase
MENPEKIAESIEKRSVSLDRKISVAPMMDWTDSWLLLETGQGLTRYRHGRVSNMCTPLHDD